MEGKRLSGLVRAPEAARVVADHPEVTGEVGELVVPLAAVDQVAVQHHQLGPGARDLIPEARPIYLEEPIAHIESIYHRRSLSQVLAITRPVTPRTIRSWTVSH